MNPNDPNVLMIEAAVRSLGTLCDRFVFVGGSTTGLLITESSRPAARATQDVDVIVELASLAGYYELERELRARGFRSDTEVTCRLHIGSLKLDVIPTQDVGLGFENRWYPLAARYADRLILPSGAAIRIVTPPYFIGTKLEAFYGRGNGDYGTSHDMEDIITVIDGRPELAQEISVADAELRESVREEFDDLLGRPEFLDSLAWHLPGDAANQARLPELIRRLREIAGS
jgi:predicted nucleotidyltransferase